MNTLNSTERRPEMCEVCNNRYPNCPACCDDGEPDNLEQPESEKNRPMPVASQETIDAMQKLYINGDGNSQIRTGK